MLKVTKTRGQGLAPKHLPPPEKQLWNELHAAYRFDDAASLALLCQALEARMRARLCRLQVQKEGQTTVDKKGTVRAHPLLAAERSAQACFLSTLRLLRIPNLDSTGERE
jgi:hypothetical protein